MGYNQGHSISGHQVPFATICAEVLDRILSNFEYHKREYDHTSYDVYLPFTLVNHHWYAVANRRLYLHVASREAYNTEILLNTLRTRPDLAGTRVTGIVASGSFRQVRSYEGLKRSGRQPTITLVRYDYASQDSLTAVHASVSDSGSSRTLRDMAQYSCAFTTSNLRPWKGARAQNRGRSITAKSPIEYFHYRGSAEHMLELVDVLSSLDVLPTLRVLQPSHKDPRSGPQTVLLARDVLVNPQSWYPCDDPRERDAYGPSEPLKEKVLNYYGDNSDSDDDEEDDDSFDEDQSAE
ncbi:hypothetical protein FISHEDRAFT_68788 [Fistulina hepatica ATCC 64428]|uniref:Uncharacterized protein n=1 Tax=Fistulina hepatica ATCC 64428 TaxID=1128425 RepID=A0A0D7AP80_9AGAR|nr:hypothetical protein FISHEDRAFT_68788 [Fistulina hepatica ATCC 64428]